MEATVSAWAPRVLSILRIAAALTFMSHGLMKLWDFPAPQPGAPDPLPTLVVHPRHGEALRTRLAAAEAAGAPPVELRTDAACGPDDCRLETEHGSVDVALEAQLARLASAWGVTLPPVGAVATDATAHDGGDAASAGGESTGGANADDASAGANGNSYHVNRAASSGAAAASRQTP